MHSPDHSTKGTPSTLGVPRDPVASGCWGVRGFRVCFIPLAGCFSPFPHGTCSLSVAQDVEPWRVVPPASHKISRVSWYSGCQSSLRPCSLRVSHPLWRCVPTPSRSGSGFAAGPTTPARPKTHWFGLLPFRSPLLWESQLISSRRATEMFQFTRCPPAGYGLTCRSPDITLEGLPHSESQGSWLVCSSP